MVHSDREAGSEPRIALKQLSAEATPEPGSWNIAWELENRASSQLQIITMRLPHGQFKSKEIRFSPPLEVPPAGQAGLQSVVRCHEPPGDVTENAFIILTVVWAGKPWRIFGRICVAVEPNGRPRATIESITTQRAGFSQSLRDS